MKEVATLRRFCETANYLANLTSESVAEMVIATFAAGVEAGKAKSAEAEKKEKQKREG